MNINDKITTINPILTAEVKGVFNEGTHVNFIRDEGKYFLVELKDGDKQRRMIVPEWFLNKFFTTEQDKLEDTEIINYYKRV